MNHRIGERTRCFDCDIKRLVFMLITIIYYYYFHQIKLILIVIQHFMSELNLKVETRGRPRKNNEEKLPPISRKLFSEHSAVFYSCCMVYVLEIFLKTKHQKRIGHSEGGFTIYEKINAVYCFENFEDDIREWNYYDIILSNPGLYEFTKTINGCAPKFVFHQLLTLIIFIHKQIQLHSIETLQELEKLQPELFNIPEQDLNKLYKYIRFGGTSLKQIKMDKWNLQINSKVRELWKPFVKIISYTVFCTEKNIEKNKYLKPFFSDAQHPEDTIIGQLNLQQIVEEKFDKNSNNHQGFIKVNHLFMNSPDVENSSEKIRGDDSDAQVKPKQKSNIRPITLITGPSNQSLPSKESPLKMHPILISPQVRRFDEQRQEKDNQKEQEPEVEIGQGLFHQLKIDNSHPINLKRERLEGEEKEEDAQIEPCKKRKMSDL